MSPAARAIRVGVLVMAHGTPARPSELADFYTSIRRGRPPSPEQLDELRGRYEAIGGISPLTERSRAQVAALAAALERRAPGRCTVRFGAKHVEPTIERAARDLLAEEPSVVVGLVLTPHRSSMGSEEYLARAAAVVEHGGGRPGWAPVRQWYAEAGFVELLAERVRSLLPADLVLFTAHSLPERVRNTHDPYEEQVHESARLVAARAGLERAGTRGVAHRAPGWDVAWQSAGRTPEPWIGPDVREVLRDAARNGVRRVVVCPIGFVADHLEVLYDIDVEAAGLASSLGISLHRTTSLNDDPRFADVLASVVLRTAEECCSREARRPAG